MATHPPVKPVVVFGIIEDCVNLVEGAKDKRAIINAFYERLSEVYVSFDPRRFRANTSESTQSNASSVMIS